MYRHRSFGSGAILFPRNEPKVCETSRKQGAFAHFMLETFEVNKVLIIAPLRVARDTWPAEIEKWDHLQGLDISVIVGDTKTRIAALHHPAMIYVINRENIKWLVEY